MKQIREIVAENLQSVRKNNGLTQVDFAKKINYSSKAVSRWENGEVLPDIETLETVANAFNLELNYFFEEHLDEEKPPRSNKNKIAVCVLAVCVVFTIMTILFVYLQVFSSYVFWQAYVWAVPISSLVVLIYNNRWFKNKTLAFWAKTIFTWSLITSFYLQLLASNIYLVFIIGVPIEACLIAENYIKNN